MFTCEWLCVCMIVYCFIYDAKRDNFQHSVLLPFTYVGLCYHFAIATFEDIHHAIGVWW